MLSVHEAVEHMLTTLTPITKTELIHIEQAVDRVLAEPVQSAINVPSYNNSAMDGFAFRAADIESDASQLRCIGQSLAGHPFNGIVGAGECIRIMTGAQVPESVDTVIPQENTLEPEANVIQMNGPAKSGANIRILGEELQIGAAVYHAGHRLTPVDIGMLASLGIAQVQVYRPLKVAVFSTGDELVLPGEQKQDFQLYDSNRFVLHAMLERMGFEVINLGLVADDPALIEAAFRNAARQADAIVCSGGVSVGDADYTKDVIEKVGQVGFWKVAMKPGKPFAFGRIDQAWFFGLPGNPVSATVTLLQLAAPALRQLSGEVYKAPLTIRVVAGEPLKKRPGRADFQRGILRYENGENRVYSAGPQGSGMLSSMVQGNCLIRLSAEQGSVEAGELVDVELLQTPIK
ncbi:MAG TPA: gephyrin-like molybdotransferase Glp [Aliidiomarina sp.]|nr:gephyrin-like molybdotransferase Glp [Aliidiomarina sp.]